MSRALIIEDDDALREELVDLLETWGFDAVSVATGEAARAAGDGPYAVVLCDYKLRTENGLDVLRSLKLRGCGDAPTPRVYLMTGHLDLTAAARDEIATLSLGLLLKPLSAGALRAIVLGETA